MKRFYFTTLLMIVILLKSNSQISILSTDMPSPGVSYLVNNKVFSFQTFPDFESGGANKVWNFSGIIQDEQVIQSYILPTSSEIQFPCRLTYNNPLDPSYMAGVAVLSNDAIDPTGSIPVQDVYDFYKTSSNSFNLVGRSASIDGIPICVKQTPTDTLYKFPLTFGMTYNSTTSSEVSLPGFGYYGQTLDRNSVVDAWGTLTLDLGVFDCIRVKSTLNIVDTMYSDSNGFGIKIPRVETHYTWLSKSYNTPLLIVKERGPMFGGTTAYWMAGVNNNIDQHSSIIKNIEVYPNPANEYIVVNLGENIFFEDIILIYDLNGKLIRQTIVNGNQKTINISDLANGQYILIFKNSKQSKSFTVNKQ